MSDHAGTATETVQQPEHKIALRRADSDDVAPPPPPVPASDPRLSIDDQPTTSDDELFKLAPTEALKLLSDNVELLVKKTGDIPPTPPPKSPTVPHMSGMQVEKENIVRSHSDKNLAEMRKQAELASKKLVIKEKQAAESSASHHPQTSFAQQSTPQDIDGVRLKQAPSAAASPPGKPEPYVVVGADSQPLNLQHNAIARKFYSKKEPPISVTQYLMRLHQFCPMSSAVYLATSLYIHRLAVEERAVAVTRRNCHRLVLAGLRVAMKALEDLSYSHAKMARVGGVSEAELARLEISFCFLAGFELNVRESHLKEHLKVLREGQVEHMLASIEIPVLRLDRKPRGDRAPKPEEQQS